MPNVTLNTCHFINLNCTIVSEILFSGGTPRDNPSGSSTDKSNLQWCHLTTKAISPSLHSVMNPAQRSILKN